jgi:branched-chain amino acid aminotransferase
MSETRIWLDGELVEWAEATVHVSSFGLHYGLGFFEGVRCFATPDGPAIFRLDDHLLRFRRSAAIYGVSLPYDHDALADACKQVVRENDLSECYLRPIAFLGAGSHPLTAKLHVAVMAAEDGPFAGAQKTKPVNARVSSFERFSPNAIPTAAKATGQYLNSFLAQTEALRSGSDEALLLNSNGQLADGWSHNVFVVTGGTVRTPPTSCGALAGITRDSIMAIGAESGLEIGESILVRSDLYVADECFLTGTAAGVVPVVTVDGRPVGTGGPGPVTSLLGAQLEAVSCGKVPDHADWRNYV